MAAKYILVIAVCLIMLQEGFSNTAAPTSGKAWEGRVQSGYARQLESDRTAAEVGRVAAVGMEKSGFKQRHIHTNSPYYGGASRSYDNYYPQQGYGIEHGQGYPLYGQIYGVRSPFGGFYDQGNNLPGQELGWKL